MKVFYDPRMSVDSGGYSPSGSKPAAVVADWMDLGIEVCGFEPASAADLCLAHSKKYVCNVLSGSAPNGHGNSIPEVTGATQWTCGSMIAAARQALIDGVACSPSSGFHHAGYDSGGGFCTFNGLIVAIEKLRSEGLIERAAILDCDAHFGDGTDEIIHRLQLDSWIGHWTFGRDAVGARGYRHKQTMMAIETFIRDCKVDGCNLMLYQAGADAHLNDPLHAGVMTSEEMRERDKLVFSHCRQCAIPVSWDLAGGYAREPDGSIPKVLALHRATMEEAIAVFGLPGRK